MSPSGETSVAIKTESDIVLARRAVREAAQALGFGATDTTRIVTAASELARNIFKYAGEGSMVVRPLEGEGRTGIELQFTDRGPGIPSIPQALEMGYSTSGGLGMGLPGAKRLMDEMDIQSAVGRGTAVTVKKWRPS
jgi:serine/threonine-protein kinase RsbT